MKKWPGALVLAFIPLLTLAQEEERFDSLRRLARIATTDSAINNAYYQLSYHICHQYPDSGIYYGRKALEIAEKNDWVARVGSAYSQIGFSYSVKSNVDSSVYYWSRAAELFEQQDSLYKVANLLNNIGGYLAHGGDYEEALSRMSRAEQLAKEINAIKLLSSIYLNYGLIDDYRGNYDKAYQLYQQALAYADSSSSISSRMEVLNNIGVMFYYMGDYEKAIPYFHRVLPFWKTKQRLSSVSYAYKNLGVCYDMLNRNDSALYYHQLALEADQQLNDLNAQGKDYHNIGVIYEKQGAYELAKKYLQRAVDLKKKSGLESTLASTYLHLAKVYLASGQHNQARAYFRQAEQLGKDYSSKEDLKDIYQFGARLLEKLGDYRAANRYLHLYQVYKDSLYQIEKIEAIHELEEKYQSERKERENQLLKQEKALQQASLSRQRAYLWLGAALLILSVVLLYLLYYRLQKKEKLNHMLTRQNEQVKTLLKSIGHQTKGQINTATALLSLQKSMAKDRRTRTALQDSENWFRALTTINKYLYYDGGQTPLLLKKSLTEIADNLKFSNERLIGKNVGLSVEVPPVNMEADKVIWIAIMANELITNSFKYAFDRTERPVIELKLEVKDNDALTLHYSDNGVGMKAHKAVESGDGLSILKDMVEQLKGKFEVQIQHGFHFNASFPKLAA